MVGGMSYQNPPPHPPDDTAKATAARKSTLALSNLPVWLSCAIGVSIWSLGIWVVGPWIADWSGMPLIASAVVWSFLVLLLIGVWDRVQQARARDLTSH